MIIWTIPHLQSKKKCSEAIIGPEIKINFSIILYVVNGLTIFSMLYAPCLLSIPENKEEEEQKHNFKEKTVINMPKDDKEMDDFL
jgi:hypothetical protein